MTKKSGIDSIERSHHLMTERYHDKDYQATSHFEANYRKKSSAVKLELHPTIRISLTTAVAEFTPPYWSNQQSATTKTSV